MSRNISFVVGVLKISDNLNVRIFGKRRKNSVLFSVKTCTQLSLLLCLVKSILIDNADISCSDNDF